MAFLLERTPHRRKAADDAVQAAAVARELDGLALALEQAGAYIDKLRLSFAEYLERWEAKRPEVLRWHDLRLMQYPASVAVTWETTFAQLTEPERRLLEVLAWLAPEPIPLFLFDAEPLVEASPILVRRWRAWRVTRWRGSTPRGTRSWSTGWCRRSPAAASPRPSAPRRCKSPWRPWMPSPWADPTMFAPGLSGRRCAACGRGQPVGRRRRAGRADGPAYE